MKKNYLLVSALFISIIGLFITSCSKDSITNNQQTLTGKAVELSGFIVSDSYQSFLRQSNLKEEDVDISQVQIQSFDHQHVNVFTIPIKRNNKLIGKLIVYSKHNGKKFQSLYEDWSCMDIQNGGNIVIQGLNKKHIATVNLTKKGDNRFLSRITDVAPVTSTPRLRSGAVEWPTSDDGWWNCTTRCFKIAKEACGDEPQCNFLCELANLAGGCTITTAVACGIYCAK